jgi:hypothetical protein
MAPGHPIDIYLITYYTSSMNALSSSERVLERSPSIWSKVWNRISRLSALDGWGELDNDTQVQGDEDCTTGDEEGGGMMNATERRRG